MGELPLSAAGCLSRSQDPEQSFFHEAELESESKPLDPELLKPLAQKREEARGPRREKGEGRICDGLSMDGFSSPCSSFKSINYGCNIPSSSQVMSSQS